MAVGALTSRNVMVSAPLTAMSPPARSTTGARGPGSGRRLAAAAEKDRARHAREEGPSTPGRVRGRGSARGQRVSAREPGAAAGQWVAREPRAATREQRVATRERRAAARGRGGGSPPGGRPRGPRRRRGGARRRPEKGGWDAD